MLFQAANFLAHSKDTGVVLLISSLAVFFVSLAWAWVRAFKYSGLYFIGCLIFSPLLLGLIFIETRGRIAIILYTIASGMVIWSAYGLDMKDGRKPSVFKLGPRFEYMFAEEKEPSPLELEEQERKTFVERQARLQGWHLSLQAKRAALKPGDDAATLAFNTEAEAYAAELQQVRALEVKFRGR